MKLRPGHLNQVTQVYYTASIKLLSYYLYIDLVIRRFLVGICLANMGYNGQFKITGSADSEWLSKSELNEIFKILPTEIKKLGELCDSNLATQQNVVYKLNR